MSVQPANDVDPCFEAHTVAAEAYCVVRSMVEAEGPVEVRASRSQLAFRRRRGFAYHLEVRATDDLDDADAADA